MWPHNQGTPVAFPTTLLQIPDQFLARFELRTCRLVAIEITYEANTECNVVQVIAVHVATVNLTMPAIPDFDLAIAR